MNARRLLFLLGALALGGCSGKKPLELPPGCQPLLDGHDCLLPYPSDFFRVEDPAQPTGFRIETSGAARLLTVRGHSADVNGGRPIDGYSKLPTLVAVFPAAVSPEGFVRLADPPEASTDLSSNSLLIEADSGRLIPHFVDFDPRATDPSRQAIVLHPIVGLKARSRYLVAIHGAKLKDSGEPVPAPEGFRRLRDRDSGGDPILEPLRQRFEESLFPVLKSAGLSRTELQLAWEFTTGSDEWATADMLKVRELTLAWLATHSPKVTVLQVEENPEADVWRRITGEVTMPLFIETPAPGAKLFRDEAGQVVQNGEATFSFEAQVPVSVRDGWSPGRPLTYGHGFFGGTNELHGKRAREISSRLNAVMFATDWWGMALADVGKVADALTGKPARTFDFAGRVPQAMANWMVLTAAMQKSMPAQPAFQRPASGPGVSIHPSGQSNALQPLYLAGASSYLGISQGHILGGVMVALNPDISRAVLNVGGCGFTHMMMRALPFEGFLGLMEITIKDPFEQQKFIATLQRPFDRIDPASYAGMLVSEELPGSPERAVLFQIGLGDSQVPNFASWVHARLAGLPVLTPSVHQPWGLSGVAAPHLGSALAVYDFQLDTEALYREAIAQPESNLVHESVRVLEPVLKQMDRFYTDGTIENFCSGGVCDPD